MDLSSRNKRKHIAQAQKRLPGDGAVPIDYVLAGLGSLPPMLIGVATVGLAVVLSIVFSAVAGGLVIVGALPALVIYFALNKPAGVLLTTHGVALYRCGFVNGRPTDLLGLDGAHTLTTPTEQRAGSTRLAMAGHSVWVRDKDLGALVAATPAAGPPST